MFSFGIPRKRLVTARLIAAPYDRAFCAVAVKERRRASELVRTAVEG